MSDKITKKYDVVIVGGGVSGVCAAIASARHGASTALVQNRPVLGGNASSEIRMHICGADNHANRPHARETGILEEILLETRLRNPSDSFSILDTVMWEKTRFQEGLDLYLNTHMTEVTTDNNRIVKVDAVQLTTEKVFEFYATLFMDATGDGTLAKDSGAEFMFGREGKKVFGEEHAPDESDTVTMGNSLLFRAVDMGKPVPFIRPQWANVYNEEDLVHRGHGEFTSGYWWIELGGDGQDVVSDGEAIRDELLKALYGVWDHIKNGGDHGADNFALDWVGFLPGKRESRRITGDYVLKEQDLMACTVFPDAVAYGGWPMDMHIPGGLRTRLEPTLYLPMKEVYTIPYRSLYSRNIENLLIGGRAISCSHMAFGSTRVMATCGVVGQAGGTAAALAIKKGVMPREVGRHIKELQQTLIRDDCFVPGFKNEDERDVARKATVTCSSQTAGNEGEKVINGHSRAIGGNSNCWVSEPLSDKGEWLELKLPEKQKLTEARLKFDSNLSVEIMVSLSHHVRKKQHPGAARELIKDYVLTFYLEDRPVHEEKVVNNGHRFCIHKLPENLLCDKVRVQVLSTNGDPQARIFEVCLYI